MALKRHLFKVILILVSIVVVLSVVVAAGIVGVEGIWFVLFNSSIRVSTVITAIGSLGLVLFLQPKILWKPLYYAVLSIIFFLAFYEILWYYLAASLFSYELRIFQFAALAGWVLLCIREVYPRKPSKISIVFYLLFAVTMILWVASGFAVNSPGNASFSITGEVFNVVSKAALAFGYAVHIGTKT